MGKDIVKFAILSICGNINKGATAEGCYIDKRIDRT